MDQSNRPNRIGRLRAGPLALWRDVFIVLFLSVAALSLARNFLVPLAFAILIFTLLTAMTERLSRLRVLGGEIPYWLASILSLTVVGSVIYGSAAILVSQARDVAEAMPRYEERIGTLLNDMGMVLGQQIAEEIRQAIDSLNLAQMATRAAGTAGAVLLGTLIVLVYLVFMSVDRAALRKRLPLAATDPETGAGLMRLIADTSSSLQRYIGVKTFVSALTGLATYAIIKPLGLDFAETWGFLAFALNFIPSIGSFLGVIMPAVIAIVQFETVTPFLIVVICCGGAQFLIGNILDPMLMGRSLNLSPLVVFLALMAWATLWGPAGAFLGVPITVCLLIVFSHIPGTRWL
ncbi:MAG: AI-2E family transporter, partial [Pseudomonadota bacterium]